MDGSKQESRTSITSLLRAHGFDDDLNPISELIRLFINFGLMMVADAFPPTWAGFEHAQKIDGRSSIFAMRRSDRRDARGLEEEKTWPIFAVRNLMYPF